MCLPARVAIFPAEPEDDFLPVNNNGSAIADVDRQQQAVESVREIVCVCGT